jgi:hypothetical protein
MPLMRPLTTNERAETPGFTHVAILAAAELTQVTAATAQTFDLCGLKAGDMIFRVAGSPVVPFQNTSVAGQNDNTVSVGDTGGVATLMAATQANWNNGAGSGVNAVNGLGNTPVLYATNNTLRMTVNSMAAMSLVNINRGEYHVFISLCRLSNVSNAIARTSPTKT